MEEKQSTKIIKSRTFFNTYLSIKTDDKRELYAGVGIYSDWKVFAERDQFRAEEYKIIEIAWTVNGILVISQGIARKKNNYQIEPREEDGRILYSYDTPRAFLERILTEQQTAMEGEKILKWQSK